MERLQNHVLGDKTYGGDHGRSRSSFSWDSSEGLVATGEHQGSLLERVFHEKLEASVVTFTNHGESLARRIGRVRVRGGSERRRV